MHAWSIKCSGSKNYCLQILLTKHLCFNLRFSFNFIKPTVVQILTKLPCSFSCIKTRKSSSNPILILNYFSIYFLFYLKALYSQYRQNKMAILIFIGGQFNWTSASSVVSFIGIPIKSIYIIGIPIMYMDFIEHLVVLLRQIKEKNTDKQYSHGFIDARMNL